MHIYINVGIAQEILHEEVYTMRAVRPVQFRGLVVWPLFASSQN